MVELKAAAPLILILLFIGPAASLSFEVNVDAVTSNTFLGEKHLNKTETLQVFNVTVENVGSIGCTYRLKGEFQQGDKQITRYSSGYPIWPGDTQVMQLEYIPMNYTGSIHTNISATYCGLEQKVADFTFNSTQINTVESKVRSKTLEANSSRAEVEIVSLTNGTLIPQETPPYWRTSSTEIEDGKAVIEYNAPIFTRDKNLTYTVLDSEGDIMGSTEIGLVTRPTLMEKLKARLPMILGGLLGLSIVVNLYQARRKLLPDKVFELIENVEFGDRDIRND